MSARPAPGWNALTSTRCLPRRAAPRVGVNALHLVALVGLLLVAPLRAETVLSIPTAPDSGATIRLAVPWTMTPRFGFAPVRISIENRTTDERTWNVQFQAGTRNYFPGVLTVDEAVTVPAAQTRDVWVFVPVAEPGINMSSSSSIMGMTSASAPPPPDVKITPTPTGTKVVRTQSFGSSGKHITETDIDTTTGTITTTITPMGGVPNTNTRTNRQLPGRTLIFTIDPATGLVSTSRAAPGSRAAGGPAFSVITAVTGTSAGFGPGPSTPMTLVAEVSGPGVLAPGRVTFAGSSTSNPMRPFAVSPVLEASLRAKLDPLVRGGPNLAVVEPAQLPADWRVWSSFSGVIMTTDEYASLDAGRRAALHGWVALGGQLCLSPVAVANAVDSPVSNPAHTENLGAGTIVTFAESLTLPAALSRIAPPAPDKTEAPAPSGATVATEATRVAAVAVEIDKRRAARAAGGGAPLPSDPVVAPEALPVLGRDVQLFAGTIGMPDQSALAAEKNGALYEVVKNDEIDNTWLAFFLMVFAVVVGPVNLFLFAPAKKRHRLFLTTPLIALAASIVLIVTILLQDGIGGSGRREALVVLLPGENQAAVFQEQAVHTGFLLGRSFALPDDVQLAMVPVDAPTYGGPETTFARGEGSATGDWFRNRTRQIHLLQRVVPTRGRIERVGTAANGAPIVQSSLGTTLRDFVCVGDKGELWGITELPAGKRVSLEHSFQWIGQRANPLLPGGSKRFSEVFAAATFRAPGRWGARGGPTELAPLATLGSIKWLDGEVIYTGAIEGDPGAGTATATASGGLL